MPKYNDFDLDIQLTNIQSNSQNPTKPTIELPDTSTSSDYTTYCTISRKFQNCPKH